MSKTIEIRNGRLFKKKLSFPELTGGDSSILFGVMDEHYRNTVNVTGDDGPVVLFHVDHIGRGVQIVARNKHLVQLRLPAPSTSYDIALFCDMVARVAKVWGASSFYDVDSGDEIPLTGLDHFKEELAAEQKTALLSLASTGNDPLTLPCGFLPISFHPGELRHFAADMDSFAMFLHSRQEMAPYYSIGLLASDPSGSPVGKYVVLDDSYCVIPIEPDVKVESGGKMRAVENYRVTYCPETDGGKAWEMPYQSFVDAVPAEYKQSFDATHLLLLPMPPEMLASVFQ